MFGDKGYTGVIFVPDDIFDTRYLEFCDDFASLGVGGYVAVRGWW